MTMDELADECPKRIDEKVEWLNNRPRQTWTVDQNCLGPAFGKAPNDVTLEDAKIFRRASWFASAYRGVCPGRQENKAYPSYRSQGLFHINVVRSVTPPPRHRPSHNS